MNALFGAPPASISVTIYFFVGLGGLWLIYLGFRLYSSKARLSVIDWIALALVTIGALNWLLEAFGIDVGGSIVPASLVSRLVYVLIGLSGFWLAYLAARLANLRVTA